MSKLEKYPKYKDSGVEWLGEVPEHWEVKPTKRFHKNKKEINTKRNCDNVLSLTLRGVVNNNIDSPEGLVPKDYATYQIFEKDNLVFKLIDLENISTSRVGLVHEKGIMSSAYIRLKVGKNSLPRFAYYYFYNLYLNQVYNNLGSGVRSTLGPTDLLNILYIKPPKQEQTKIANYLDQKTAQIDKAISLKEQMIEKLQERRQILINDAVTKGLDPNVKMKDSGVEWLGKVPVDWEVKRLKYIFKIRKRIVGILGYDVLSITQKGIKIKDITSGEGQLSMDYSKYQLVYKNEFAMNHMDLLTGYVDISKYDGVISPDYRVFTLEHRSCSKEYFLYLLQMGYKNRIFYAYGQGVSMLGRWRFPSDNFYNFFMPIPPLKEQVEIIEYIKENTQKIDKAISLQQKQIEKLKEYKASLIDSVVTGKVRVV
ncbi:restriction endonuclease subunit S [Sulfurimonas hydrogeniphila]|uniref:restriction endonuclease subunit S n=1 Tax=Sulfurimonas hydrogeniphila TaxID=2509341 RepID=UPI00125FDCD9|nr:restriction endonuclease subunit S [Sulfurimonas hydrogeniphila]